MRRITIGARYKYDCRLLVAIEGNKIAPGMIDQYLARTNYEAQQTDESITPSAQRAALYTVWLPNSRPKSPKAPTCLMALHFGWSSMKAWCLCLDLRRVQASIHFRLMLTRSHRISFSEQRQKESEDYCVVSVRCEAS